MTLSTNESKQQYNGDDSQTIFPYEFKIFDEDELNVELRLANGTIDDQVLNTDFTTTTSSGDYRGNIVMIVPPATDETLTVYRLVDLLQETDYVENDPFKAETHEDALDKLTMQNQQQADLLDRSLKIPITDSSTLNTELVGWETRAGKYLAFNANGEPIATQGTAESPRSAFMETFLDDEDAPTARTTLGSGTFGDDWFTYTTLSQAINTLSLDYLENIIEDTTPQLGGDLELNGHNIDLGSILTVDETYKGKIMTVTVDDASAAFGKLLYQAADFNFELSDPTDASPYKMPVRVMALESGTGSKKVLIEGQVCKTSWNWSAGDLFATTSGDMTLTTPALSGDKVQKVGYTLSADTVYFKPDSTTVEKA